MKKTNTKSLQAEQEDLKRRIDVLRPNFTKRGWKEKFFIQNPDLNSYEHWKALFRTTTNKKHKREPYLVERIEKFFNPAFAK